MIKNLTRKPNKILLVDDDDIALFLHTTILEDIFTQVEIIPFNSGELALNYINQNIDEQKNTLIFLDINMPNMDGWQFLDLLSKNPAAQKSKVVMVTSSVERSEKEKALSIPLVKHFLIKPVKTLDIDNLRNLPTIASFFEVTSS